MKIWKYTITGIFISLYSCDNKIDNKETYPIEISVSGKAFGLDSVLIFPTEIDILDSVLLVTDNTRKSLVSLINIKSGQLVKQIGSIGEGPGELLPPINVVLDNSEYCYFYSRTQSRLVKFNFKTKNKEVNKETENFEDGFRINAYYDKIGILGDSTFIGTGIFDNKNAKYMLIHNKENLTLDYGFPMNSNDLPSDYNFLAYQSNLKVKTDKKKFVNASIFCEHFEIFEISPDFAITKSFEHNKIDLKWFDSSQGDFKQIQFKEEQKFGYIDIATNDTYIFLLFSGRNRKEFKNQALSSKQIHVHQWTGELLYIINLNYNIYRLAVSKDNKMIYGITNDPIIDIVEFKLDNKL